LAPWVEHREQQGHRLAIVSNLTSAEKLRETSVGTARGCVPVAVGPTPHPGMQTDAKLGALRGVPPHVPAKINVRYGSEPMIATTIVGRFGWRPIARRGGRRLPADSPAELTVMVRKILDYERCADFGPWRRQVHFVAGLGAGGALTDMILEAAAKSIITKCAGGHATSMTYGSWQSPYCPDPSRF